MTSIEQKKENTPKQNAEEGKPLAEKAEAGQQAAKDTAQDLKAKKAAEEKERNARVGRIIIRNIQYDMRCNHLQKEFGKFGKIVDTNVPMKSDKPNLNRGFGFVEFETKE